MTDKFRQRRLKMVQEQLEDRGIEDPAVLRAFRKVPRERFVNRSDREQAYDDRALPTRSGQTISQPYMVAVMTESLEVEPDDKVLEIGTGSGYQAAILSEMGVRVFTIERYESLSQSARETLEELGLADRVSFKVGDGTLGWLEHAPYEGIIVTAGAPEVPEPLKRQTAIGGRIVIPVGTQMGQTIKVLTKLGEDDWSVDESVSCVFVPLKGEEGWEPEG